MWHSDWSNLTLVYCLYTDGMAMVEAAQTKKKGVQPQGYLSKVQVRMCTALSLGQLLAIGAIVKHATVVLS